ncbi:phosphatase PAP2 family protein [Candidatus Peregrinibacteria bacterium]|nr:phosphatase PAP2 family protein [Candidatus Peregrinibacteria bacterium]MBI5732861.1 phosphatase PAP2 family protein [Candidatus Jorgensenbacteria bacterium]
MNVSSDHITGKVLATFNLTIILAIILLAVSINSPALITFDTVLSDTVQNITIPGFAKLMSFVSWWGSRPTAQITILVIATIFLIFSRLRETFFVLLTFIADALNIFIKDVVARPRPDGASLLSPSFPSGHVVHYVVLFGFIFVAMIFIKKIPQTIKIVVGLFCFALILLVPISRVYLGDHWPTDVIGGYLVGLFFLSSITYFYLAKTKHNS